MQSPHLYDKWYRRFEQLHPEERVTKLRLFTWVLIGILMSKSVHLYRIALLIPGEAKLVSTTRRLTRFFDNASIHVRKWYEPVARDLIMQIRDTLGEIRLIADGSKVGFHHQLLIISIAYRRRSLPLVWTWVRSERGHSSAVKQIALLEYAYNLIGENVAVHLTGDSEFGSVEVIDHLEWWSWSYVLRERNRARRFIFQTKDGGSAVSLSVLLEKNGGCRGFISRKLISTR